MEKCGLHVVAFLQHYSGFYSAFVGTHFTFLRKELLKLEWVILQFAKSVGSIFYIYALVNGKYIFGLKHF